MNNDVYVCKGFIIPKRGHDGNPIYVKEFTKDEMEALYNKYKKFLKSFIETYMKLNNKNMLRTVDDINDLLDSLIFYLKSIIIVDPVPDYIVRKLTEKLTKNGVKELAKNEKYIPSPTIILQSLILEEFREELYDELDSMIIFDEISVKTFEKMATNIKKYIDNLKELSDSANDLLCEPNILDFPADTGVGSNTSSLILHLLIVSAIATTIYICRNGRLLYDLTVLRLLSLFHDVGKMKDWHHHENESMFLLEEIFKDIVVDDAKNIIEKVKKLIDPKNGEREHDNLYKIFKEADKLASKTDILPHIILELLSPTQKNKIESKLEGKRFEDEYNKWEFWCKFDNSEIRELTEDFCKNASNIERIAKLIRSQLQNDDIPPNEILVTRLDFKSIQSFISNRYIKVMNGGSRFVDTFIFVLLPLYLCKHKGLFPENILYNGGGNITLIIPANETINGILEDNEKIKYIRSVSAYLHKLFINTNRKIDEELTKRKLTELEDVEIDNNLYKLCKSCGKEPINYNNEPKETEEFCKYCRYKAQIGQNYHFKYKIEMLEPGVENEKERLLLEKILEYIAGHEVSELTENNIRQQYKDIALIKFDGNIMGQLMASSISLTDAFERSIRIDYSIKKSFHDFLNLLIDKELCEYAKRIIMGLQYIGGDDGLIITPAIISIPFALHMINEYHLNMGRRSTLSVGIAIAKPKHPIQLLKDGAEYLLNKSKSEARTHTYEIYRYNNNDFKGALAFYVADGDHVSKESLLMIFDKLSEEGLSNQPYLVTDNNGSSRSINRLLNIIIGDVNDPISALLEFYSYKIGLKDEKLNYLKDLRNICLKNIQVNISQSRDIKLKILYSIKESQGAKNNSIYNIAKNLILLQENKFVLYDLYLLLKAMGVEGE